MAITASRRTAMPQQRGPRAHRPTTKDPLAIKNREITMRDSRPTASSSRPSSLTQLQITGWRKSKFSSSADGGISSLTKFIERRGTIAQNKHAAASNGIKKSQPVRIRKSKVEGDALIISVPTEDVKSILSANGYEFGGINIKIELLPPRGPRSSAASFSFGKRSTSPIDTADAEQTVSLFKAVLARRYNMEQKLLDLSSIGQDPDLNKIGITDITGGTRHHQFFRALMKVVDTTFTTRAQKEESVVSISLANNNLKDVVPVTVLSMTFPDLKNLDLSGNQLSSTDDLSRWRYRFKKLEHIILTNNPLEQNDPKFKQTLARQFPNLKLIDLVPIPAEDLKKPTPPKVQSAHFKDEGGIAEQFLQNFIQGYDNDRPALVQYYYDATSTFSFSVNTKGLRDPSEPKVLAKGEWSAYTRESRNLTMLNNPVAKINRSHRGVEAITKIFSALPDSKHPDFAANPEKWMVECQGLPGLPDPTGASPAGVNGLRITLHGEFEEVGTKKRRSFDRTFILGPGGPNGVRVVNDMMTIRGYGGSLAFQPEAPDAAVADEAREKEIMVMELSRITGMNAQYSLMCLEQVNFVPADALAAFERARETIPPEAFITVQ